MHANVTVFVFINFFIQLTKLAKRIFHSSVLREDLAESCVKARIKPKNVVRSVPTRWNLVAETLRRSLYLCSALEKLVMIERHNTAKSVQLKRFKLKKEEWELLIQLEPILSVNIFFLVQFYMLITNHSAFSQSNRKDVAIQDSPSIPSHSNYRCAHPNAGDS